MKAPRIMIAAPKSGSGKTMITCALLEALKERDEVLSAFKCGPDYIDPMFHRRVIGVDSRNLDGYFSGEKQLQELFVRGRREGELSVLEGVMGLYDGLGGIREEASSYDVARALKVPVILVVDAKGMGRSILPLLAGFLQYDTEGLIRGVILNRVSKGFCELLAPEIERELGILVLGHFPERQELVLESRHLGLRLPGELKNLREQIQMAASVLEESVDVSRILALAQEAEELPESTGSSFSRVRWNFHGEPRVRIGVAKDEAFCFYYEDNLRLLQDMGAELVYFSPLHDGRLPDGLHGLLLGGGYPELYGAQLAANETMRTAIRNAIEDGMPSAAECGGFMYLHEWIADSSGEKFPMCGIVPGGCHDAGKLVRFGYVEIREKHAAFVREGGFIRGHEFHYFDSDNNGKDCTARKPVSGRDWDCVHENASHWWGFAHLYYLSAPEYAEHFVRECRKYRG